MTYIKPILPAVLLMLLALEIFQRKGWRRFAGVGLTATLLLASWRPVAYVCLLTLEGWYEAQPTPAQPAEAIVVLAGGTLPLVPPTPAFAPSQDTYLRCRRAAWLYTHWKALPIFVSGGSEQPRLPPAAVIMRSALEAEGIPGSSIEIEAASHSTYENALYTARLLRQRAIRRAVLVTEAVHMLRAEKAFRKQGIEVVPAPCAFRSAQFLAGKLDLIPSLHAYRDVEDVLHEWVGLLWYAACSRI